MATSAINDPNLYRLEMLVRDYEVDMQGRVNNATYINYCEHARHEYIKTCGYHFDGLMAEGYYFVALKTTIQYYWPLTFNDQFIVTVDPYRHRRNGIAFKQVIYRSSDQRHIIDLEIIAGCVNPAGRPVRFPYYDKLVRN